VKVNGGAALGCDRPVCHGSIAKVFIGHAKYPYDFTCNGTWRGKVGKALPARVFGVNHLLNLIVNRYQCVKQVLQREHPDLARAP
jgi:hypothetical protein